MSGAESREEYLEAIFKLAATDEGATVTRIAHQLGVKPASASQMVGRLHEAGWVYRDESNNNRIILTEAGRAEAVRLVRRHRLSECFLTDYLELPWDEVHEEACRLEHVLSEASEAGLARRLGHPRTCPHGRIIPYDAGTPAPESIRSLADLEPGEACVVSHISDETPELLRYLGSSGLRPGSLVQLREIEPFEGPLIIIVGDACRPLGREAARKVFVSRPDEAAPS
jgi:DtxR family Mn-dependent transcriptional regulator